jgi:hypothetical protein
MQVSIIAASAAFAAALIALVVYHVAFAAPALRRAAAALAAHDELLGNGAAASGTTRLSSLEEAQTELGRRAERAESRLRELDALSRTDVSRIGFVRYDAFEDTGSELSYALALLNRQGDGVVLSSIYSRTDTRTFGKRVQAFKPLVHASAEELAAIEQALGSSKAS